MFSGSVQDICSSDHKPVFATFEVGVANQFVSTKSKGVDSTAGNHAKIIFKEISAEVKFLERSFSLFVNKQK